MMQHYSIEAHTKGSQFLILDNGKGGFPLSMDSGWLSGVQSILGHCSTDQGLCRTTLGRARIYI